MREHFILPVMKHIRPQNTTGSFIVVVLWGPQSENQRNQSGQSHRDLNSYCFSQGISNPFAVQAYQPLTTLLQ